MKKILLLDDDVILLNTSHQVVALLGYDPISFSNPLRALELFYDFPNQFQLVITDYEMPEINGVEFSQEILKIRPELPIIMYSGHTKETIREYSEISDLIWFLRKPFEIDELAEIIQSALNEKSSILPT